MTHFAGLAKAGTQDDLAELARASGWIELAGEPWRFTTGQARSWWTQGGSTVQWLEATRFGASVLSIDGRGSDHDALCAGLSDRFHLVDLAACLARAGALDPGERVTGLLEVRALLESRPQEDDEMDPAVAAAFAAALDNPDPIVRLTGLRMLSVLPSAQALALLEGREDPTLLALSEWRELFAGLVEKERGHGA
jgi:hypothetical protein